MGMRVDIVTLFPEMCQQVLDASILGRAAKRGYIETHCHQIRDYTLNKQKQTDDYPYGGGCGMVLYAQPIADCLRAVQQEVAGAMSLTKITNPQVIRIAAISAILFSVVGKISALLKSIPSAVLGGIMLLLFGTIACAGIGNLVNNCIDLSRTRNIIIVSLTLTVGIGGAVLTWGDFSLSGIGLAALVGVLLNLILPKDD